MEADEKSWCTLTAEANNKVLGKRLGKALAGVKKALGKLDTAALWPLLEVRGLGWVVKRRKACRVLLCCSCRCRLPLKRIGAPKTVRVVWLPR